MGRKTCSWLLCVSVGAAAVVINPGGSARAGSVLTPDMTLQAQELGLKPGDVAPDFSLPGSDGQTYRLADFVGQRPVVLAWFPKTITKL
jgi:hypothetical protein